MSSKADRPPASAEPPKATERESGLSIDTPIRQKGTRGLFRNAAVKMLVLVR